MDRKLRNLHTETILTMNCQRVIRIPEACFARYHSNDCVLTEHHAHAVSLLGAVESNDLNVGSHRRRELWPTSRSGRPS